MIRRKKITYTFLATAWVVVMAWQVAEHNRVRQAARTELINRAKDISGTLGVVMRSQRRFGGAVFKDRLESALNSLVKPGELNAIALLNTEDEIVASAGKITGIDPKQLALSGEPRWDRDTVTVMNLVDLGSNVTNTSSENERGNPTIVLPPPEMFDQFNTNHPGTNQARTEMRGGPPPPPPDVDERHPRRAPESRMSNTNESVSADTDSGDESDEQRSRRSRRSRFRRPFWMDEEEYKSLIQKQGVHSFVLVLSNQSMHEVCRQDLWMRAIIGALASVSVVGIGLAWRNLARSSELELRLVRAAELNTRLREMNLAAAGLAHETRNPLNIVRGLAQIISRRDDASTEVRTKAREIIDESDRVTAQLNEFINYSRPREVRRTAVSLASVVGEVARALSTDVEEKSISLEVAPDMPVIEGDEQLLRQALFNLILNAVQAADPGGEIRVRVEKTGLDEACLEIRDNGPGVSPENRTQIFKPYFTTHQKGTGLGLAVVHQIILAHGWEIICLPNEPRGAVFRISHMRLINRK